MKVLFVCLANVGRSQMAEGFYNHLTSSTHASSAGVEAYEAKYKHPTRDIIQAMHEVRIDVSKQRVKHITEEMLDVVDKVVVLCKRDECPVFLSINSKVIFREVEDPFEYEKMQLNKVRDEIKEIVRELIKENDTIAL